MNRGLRSPSNPASPVEDVFRPEAHEWLIEQGIIPAETISEEEMFRRAVAESLVTAAAPAPLDEGEILHAESSRQAAARPPKNVEDMTNEELENLGILISLGLVYRSPSPSPSPSPRPSPSPCPSGRPEQQGVVEDLVPLDDSEFLPVHQLFGSVHQQGLSIDSAFDQFVGFLAQAYPGRQFEEFAARRLRGQQQQQLQPAEGEAWARGEGQGDEEEVDASVPPSLHTPGSQPPVAVLSSGGQPPAPFVSLVDIEGPAKEVQAPSLSEPELEDGQEPAGVAEEGGETEASEREEEEEDDAALPASQEPAVPAANTNTTTSSSPAPPPVEDRENMPWIDRDIQAAGRAMQWVLAVDPGTWTVDDRYEQCAARMERESGIRRSWKALRSAYNRRVRQATGVDERKTPKPHRLQTSVQKTGKRSAPIWKAAAVAAKAGKAADKAMKEEKKRKREEEKEAKKGEREAKRRRKGEEEEEKGKGKRRRAEVDEEDEEVEKAPRRIKRVRFAPRSSDSPKPGDEKEEEPAVAGAAGEGSASAEPDTQAAQVAADEALARRLHKEETARTRSRRARRG
ncbi:hypothetical protein SLS55_002339 [Diplodia seriata]|uniref:Myb-like domain-containing protein n=1 Tax=Diplodia seriata TaxID=420778 RepID=A0ABR3CRX8_9PEZI